MCGKCSTYNEYTSVRQYLNWKKKYKMKYQKKYKKKCAYRYPRFKMFYIDIIRRATLKYFFK